MCDRIEQKYPDRNNDNDDSDLEKHEQALFLPRLRRRDAEDKGESPEDGG